MRDDGATLSHSSFDFDSLLEGVTDDDRRTVRTVWVTGFAPGSRKPDALKVAVAAGLRKLADLEEAGLRGECHAEVYLKNFDHRLPHGIPWTAYPVLPPPRLKRRASLRHADDFAHVVDPYPAKGIERSHNVPSMTALVEAREMIVDVHAGAPDARQARLDALLVLAWACLLVPDLAPNVRRIGFRDEGGTFAWHAPEEAAARVRGMLGWMRFRYGYMVNANAILAKAVAHAISGVDLAEVAKACGILGIEAGRREFGNGAVALGLAWQRRHDAWQGNLHDLCHPLSLQMLFRIARRGGIPEDPSVGGTRLRGFLPGLFDGEPVYSGDSFALAWAGTGKHAAQVYDRTQAYPMVKSLAALGLVHVEKSGRLGLTAAGRRFLDAVHPDMEDPDVVCRWIPAILANEDIGARADAWLGRCFSKCKTRVNELRPGSPDLPVPGPTRALPPAPWEV